MPETNHEVVLFIHSTGTGPALWAGVPKAVIGGRAALFPPNVGYPPGNIVARPQQVTAEDDARCVLQALPGAATRVHLVAHSYGGLVALHVMQLLGPRLASSFIYEPVAFGYLLQAPGVPPAALDQARQFSEAGSWFLTDLDRGGTDEWLQQFVDYWNRKGSWSRMPEPMRAATRSLGWKMFQEVRACFADELQLEGLTTNTPTTIAYGAATTAASLAMSKALSQGRANVTLVELPGLSHMAPLTHPQAIHAELAQHFERLESSSDVP